MNKQYLLMIDESAMDLFKQVFSGFNIQFLEVQGMTMSGGVGNVLVTPIRPPVPQMEIPAQQLAAQHTSGEPSEPGENGVQ